MLIRYLPYGTNFFVEVQVFSLLIISDPDLNPDSKLITDPDLNTDSAYAHLVKKKKK